MKSWAAKSPGQMANNKPTKLRTANFMIILQGTGKTLMEQKAWDRHGMLESSPPLNSERIGDDPSALAVPLAFGTPRMHMSRAVHRLQGKFSRFCGFFRFFCCCKIALEGGRKGQGNLHHEPHGLHRFGQQSGRPTRIPRRRHPGTAATTGDSREPGLVLLRDGAGWRSARTGAFSQRGGGAADGAGGRTALADPSGD